MPCAMHKMNDADVFGFYIDLILAVVDSHLFFSQSFVFHFQ